MSLQRPPTRERQQGRIALTVLEAAAGLLGAGAAATSAGLLGDSQQQQPLEPSSSTNGAGSKSWQQQQQQATGRTQVDWQQQQEQDQPLSTATNKVSLKVRLWVKRGPLHMLFLSHVVSTSLEAQSLCLCGQK